MSLEMRCDSSSFALPFQNCFSYYSSLPFSFNFRISLCIFTKNLAGALTGIALNLLINLERFDIFTILCLPIHEHRFVSPFIRFPLIFHHDL